MNILRTVFFGAAALAGLGYLVNSTALVVIGAYFCAATLAISIVAANNPSAEA